MIVKQINWNKQFKNITWRHIIKAKIINQLEVLKIYNYDSTTQKQLYNYATSVGLADRTNREGHAAKVYFNQILGESISRRDPGLFNTCLDYIYSIIRALFARFIVAYGFTGLLGIHHKMNSINLI